MVNRATLYRVHCENFRSVGKAFESVTGAARQAIRSRDSDAVTALTYSSALLLGAKIECRLKRLIFEPASFTETERIQVTGSRSQIDRWSAAIDVGFRRRYNVWRLDSASIGSQAVDRHEFLQQTLDAALRPVVEIRNKLAHGQWEHVLNYRETDISPDIHSLLRTETVETLSIKDRIAYHYAKIIEDLVISASAFERDYQKSVEKLQAALTNLESADFTRYEAMILRRTLAGKAKRLTAGSV